MQQHIAKAHECASNLVPFFQAVIAEDWSRVELVQQEMSRLEKEADKLKRNVRIHLPKSLFLPVPRSDLLELLSVQDKVANRAKDIAGLMLGRQMVIPQPLQPMILAFVQRSVDASDQALTAMNELDEILETGFGNREVNRVTAMIEVLEDIEHDTDRMQIEVRRTMSCFSIPSSNGLVMSLTALSVSATDWNNCSRASYLARPTWNKRNFYVSFN